MLNNKIVLGAIFILILVAGVVFFKTQNLQPNAEEMQSSQKPALVQVSSVPAGWETYKSGQLNFEVSFPEGFEVLENGENSIMISKKVSEPGQGPSNFVYISVVPEGSQDREGRIYNFNKSHLESLLKMSVNEQKVLEGEDPGLSEYVTFTRLPDEKISGNYAKTFMNLKPWEFPQGTKEYRYIIDQENATFLIGGYISTTEHHNYTIDEDTYHKIISTTRLPQPSDSKMIHQVVDNFYQSYMSCMKNPPMHVRDNVAFYCQTNTDLTSEDFEKKLQEGGVSLSNADPVTCSQNPPEMITVQNANPAQNTALVTEKYGPLEIQITVKVAKVNNEWKVDNILCPQP